MDAARKLIRAFFKSVDDGLGLLRAEPELMNERTGVGETPLHYLAVENHIEGVRTLVEFGAEVNTSDDFDQTPLAAAAFLGHEDLVRYLLSVGAKCEPAGGLNPILIDAVRSGNLEIVRMLVDAGADVNQVDNILETPLHSAVTSDENIELVRFLVREGSDISAKRLFDETPLDVAREEGATAIADELSKLGAL